MPLADEIRGLRGRTLAELAAAHDYFAHSESAWNFVRQTTAADPTLTFQNLVTGTTATGPGLAALARDYIGTYVARATFQQFQSIFEVFVGDLLRLWLAAYPGSLGKKELTLGDVLDAGDLAAVVRRVIDHEVSEVTYKSPREVFKYLGGRIKFPDPPADEVDRLAEAKATRDVLVHSGGVADAEYVKKAGRLARATAGERIEIPKDYHREVWELLGKLVAELADGALAKVPA